MTTFWYVSLYLVSSFHFYTGQTDFFFQNCKDDDPTLPIIFSPKSLKISPCLVYSSIYPNSLLLKSCQISCQFFFLSIFKHMINTALLSLHIMYFLPFPSHTWKHSPYSSNKMTFSIKLSLTYPREKLGPPFPTLAYSLCPNSFFFVCSFSYCKRPTHRATPHIATPHIATHI